jgi:L-amino acid N-acyltransferase YncA
MKATFVPAEHKDIEILLELINTFYKYEQIEFDEKASYESVQKLLSDSSLGKIWLIYYEETIVGYCILVFGYSLEYRGRDAFIDEIYVKEDFRRKGI